MNKVVSRLLVFFIGIPLVVAIIWFPYPSNSHLTLHLLICALSVFGSHELYRIFSSNLKLHPKWLIISGSVLIPFVCAIYEMYPAFSGTPFPVSSDVITLTLIMVFLVMLAYEVLTAKSFEYSNQRLAASFFIVMYTGYIISFISRMCSFTKDGVNVSTPLIAIFAVMVFMCDSLAWFFGILLGKNNKGFIKASPNKSIAGFCGGFVGSILTGIAATLIFPNVFSGSPLKMVLTGVLIAFSSIVGDLAESIFKRCSGCKDSGHVIPGRGGVLDSIDSILMSAPIYYLLITILYGPLK